MWSDALRIVKEYLPHKVKNVLCTCTYIHTYTHTYIHTYIHVCSWMNFKEKWLQTVESE